MSTIHNAAYLESRVLTASQPQLQLMLIEGALRFGEQAKQFWDDDAQSEQVSQILDRMANIAEELVYSTAAGSSSISKQLEEQHAFLYRELALCRIDHDLERFESCLKLLDYQRETWKMACERLESNSAMPTTSPVSIPVPHVPFSASDGFSLEA
jgi:flagellar secretion chaperone FliS